MESTQATVDPIRALPDPKVVQERLAENLREARLLRQMLRLTRKAAEQRQRAEVAAR